MWHLSYSSHRRVRRDWPRPVRFFVGCLIGLGLYGLAVLGVIRAAAWALEVGK
jgi:hypothetical protein